MAESRVMGLGEFLRVFFRYLRPYRVKAVLLFLLVVVDVGFKTAWPLSFKFLIDHAIGERDRQVLVLSLLLLTGAVLLVALSMVGRDFLYAFFSARIAHDVRTRVFAHLQRLSLGFFARHQAGDLMARFSTDLAAMETSVSWMTVSLTLNFLNVVVSAVILATLEWRLALLTLGGLILCAAVPRGLSGRAGRAAYEKKTWEADLASVVQENVTAQSVVKAFGLQRRASESFASRSLDCSRQARRFYFLSNLVERTPNTIILITEVAVMGFGIFLVFEGSLTLGTLVAFHALYMNLSSAVEGLTWVMPVLLQSLGGVQRIEELLAEPVAEALDATEEGARTAPPLARSLEFRDVTFGYAEGRKILDRVSLEIPKGAFVALVGPSGSGKSTVLNLLLRFHEARQGSVLLDGEDVRGISRAGLRAQMGVVFQENCLFNLSIRENIRLGRPEATDLEVESAARAADIHDAILEMPGGYAAPAGERGGNLSGGQRQRVAIARALLRNPAVLILDEATSALDAGAEEAVNATIRQAARGRTVLAVTHRLAAVTGADRIFVFQSGRVVEAGRHEELLARNGVYATLWRKQTGFALLESGELAEVRPAALRRYPILQDLDESALEDVACLFVTEVYGPRRTVVQQGDPGDRFYIIVRGRVSVVRDAENAGEEMVSILEDGDYFGEIALLRNVPRTASVRTLGACVFLSLQRQHFHLLLKRAPGVLAALERGRGRS